MNTKGSFTVLFLCFLTLFTLTDCSTCQTNKLEGDSLTYKVADRAFKQDDKYSVKKDNKIVQDTKGKTGPWIMKGNVLELHNLKLSDSGKYDVESFDGSGTKLKLYTEMVCVYAKVPKPRVNITCQNEQIDLRCGVESGKDLSYIWHKNGKEIKKTASLENVPDDNSKYTCTVQNPVHKNTSDAVEATCYKPHLLFGFDFWIMVGILAGGGALVLILIIVLVSLSCRACKRKEKQELDAEEFRLNYHNTSPNHGQQKSKLTARGQPAPPEPYDNCSAHEVPCEAEPKPRTQQRARPPPPPIDDEEEHPPPLPQPRKKAHHNKYERPM